MITIFHIVKAFGIEVITFKIIFIFSLYSVLFFFVNGGMVKDVKWMREKENKTWNISCQSPTESVIIHHINWIRFDVFFFLGKNENIWNSVLCFFISNGPYLLGTICVFLLIFWFIQSWFLVHSNGHYFELIWINNSRIVFFNRPTKY